MQLSTVIPIIHPDSKFRHNWDMIILVVTLYLALEIPISLVFELPNLPILTVIDWIISMIFIADLIFNFSTAIEEQGKLVTDRHELARRYFRSWFWVDLVAALPISLFFGGARVSVIYRLVKLLRFNRLIKLVRITGTLRGIGGSQANPAILRLMLLIFWILLAAHIVTCGWIFIAGNPDNLGPVSLYIRSLYWTVTTLTTIGYGDITPENTGQTIFVIFIEILGAGMYGLIIGNIANLIANIDVAKAQFREKVEKVNTFLKYRNIPGDLRKKINNYYGYLWESRRGYDEMSVIADLPEPLQVQVSLFLNQDIIKKVPIFEGASPEFLKELIINLKPVVFTPGDFIVTAGELGDEMYFISRGTTDVVSEDGQTVYATLTDGQFFGEIALLLSTPRNASIIAREYCDLFELKKDTFDRILERYQDFEKNIRELAETRRKANLEASQKQGKRGRG